MDAKRAAHLGIDGVWFEQSSKNFRIRWEGHSFQWFRIAEGPAGWDGLAVFTSACRVDVQRSWNSYSPEGCQKGEIKLCWCGKELRRRYELENGYEFGPWYCLECGNRYDTNGYKIGNTKKGVVE